MSKPQYPQWLHDLLGGTLDCPQCRRDLEFADMVGLGVFYPDDSQTFNRAPRARLFALCPKCSTQSSFEFVAERRGLIGALEAFFDLIEAEREVTEQPSPFAQLQEPASDEEATCDGNCSGESDAAKAFEQNKRRKRKKLAQMPTDAEVEAFTRKLAKASLKRSSKSFRRFMEQLGIDIDAPVDADDGNDDEEAAS
jgi:hypothetical protein